MRSGNVQCLSRNLDDCCALRLLASYPAFFLPPHTIFHLRFTNDSPLNRWSSEFHLPAKTRRSTGRASEPKEDEQSLKKDEQETKLLQKPGDNGQQPPLIRRRSRLSSASLNDFRADTGDENSQGALKTPTWTSFSRSSAEDDPAQDDPAQDDPAQDDPAQIRESRYKVVPSDNIYQFEFYLSEFGNSTETTAAEIASKMKSKPVKGMITGVGKELRRAATSVGEKLPTPARRKSKAEKDRQQLMEVEPQRPQVRNLDEIKRAYGHAADTNYTAGLAHDKLRERGEKLSGLQRRTGDLEADAANFSDLTDQLVKKMESRKWYAI